ncbi:TetR family transcriptional regulator [Verrucosispora sp. CWR15]|uniref:TetR family transcriptional regulator n=1 Tax=Verrucosispora sioxanthis TaxID=2499994 RepID=A0A6M1L4Q1_9ACTN|nr:TetR/AcrR family transcriptional regulator [Verrucosispora sioxanthis]NEE62444.1 TetR family transcriptional regulator [Verrucosispora sioxanthis]NGM11554.1 TetR family transcriptional regulator [Verrucosispora sioxanthis]
MARANLTRAVVTTAAAELADREGFEAITLSALARHFGVQTASLYSHVRDRSALLDSVHELALGELADRIAVAIGGRARRDALTALADAHRDYARQCPGRWAALQRPAAASTVRSDAAGRLVALTLAMLRGYRLPETELVHATRLLGATINGFLALEVNGSFGHREPSSDVSWQRALSALDTAFRSWPTEENH